MHLRERWLHDGRAATVQPRAVRICSDGRGERPQGHGVAARPCLPETHGRRRGRALENLSERHPKGRHPDALVEMAAIGPGGGDRQSGTRPAGTPGTLRAAQALRTAPRAVWRSSLARLPRMVFPTT
jgi:hypothetical protein